MKITDEAVQAAVVAMNTNNLVAYDSLIAQQEANARSILTAAIPYLHPVDVAAVRRQAFEEAAKTLDALGDIYGDNAAACVRALSAEPAQCKTCNGHGVVGRMIVIGGGEVDYNHEDCPDCTDAEPAQGEQWQPIETCPPENVLFYGEDRFGDSRVFEGYRAVNGTLHVGDKDSKPVKITHWMPLPAAPTSEEAQ